MFRIRLSIVTLGMFFVAATASAMDVKGKVTALDLEKQTISVKGDDDEQTFDFSKDVKVYKLFGGGKQGGGFREVEGGMKTVSVGATVNLSTEFIDGNEQVVRIKLESASNAQPVRAVGPKRNPAAAKEKRATTTDVNGKITALDGKNLSLTLTVDGKPKKYTADKDCKVFVSKPGDKNRFDVAPEGMADIKVGADVKITVDSQSGKELVTMVKINTPAKK